MICISRDGVLPACPVHKTSLRIEWHKDGRTGFCLACTRHYELCSDVMFMEVCQQLDGHEGDHITREGTHFSEIKPMLPGIRY